MHSHTSAHTKWAAGRCARTLSRNCRPSVATRALKRPSQLLPPSEDKAVQCLVETGIRGSLAMLAVSALQLDLFSHLHWVASDVATGLQLAVPCAAVDVALLTLYSTLLAPSGSTSQLSSSSSNPLNSSQQQTDQAAAKTVLLAAADSVYLHNIRYSLIGAATPRARAALEAASQMSEELLARGALLGCASAWLANRFLEASICGDTPLMSLDPIANLTTSTAAATTAQLLPCGTTPSYLAAAGLCAIMASRFVVHSRGKAAATRSAREADTADAAARRAVLRYEPLAVQQAAAEAAGGVGSFHSEIDAEAAALLAAAEAETVERLAQGWLGARFVLGQACLFGAFIATDNLLASFAAGLAMQLVSGMCCEKYLQRATAS